MIILIAMSLVPVLFQDVQDYEISRVREVRIVLGALERAQEKGVKGSDSAVVSLRKLSHYDTTVIRAAIVCMLSEEHAEDSVAFLVLQYIFDVPAEVDEYDGPFLPTDGGSTKSRNWPLIFDGKKLIGVKGFKRNPIGSYSVLAEFERLRIAYGRREDN